MPSLAVLVSRYRIINPFVYLQIQATLEMTWPKRICWSALNLKPIRIKVHGCSWEILWLESRSCVRAGLTPRSFDWLTVLMSPFVFGKLLRRESLDRQLVYQSFFNSNDWEILHVIHFIWQVCLGTPGCSKQMYSANLPHWWNCSVSCWDYWLILFFSKGGFAKEFPNRESVWSPFYGGMCYYNAPCIKLHFMHILCNYSQNNFSNDKWSCVLYICYIYYNYL